MGEVMDFVEDFEDFLDNIRMVTGSQKPWNIYHAIPMDDRSRKRLAQWRRAARVKRMRDKRRRREERDA